MKQFCFAIALAGVLSGCAPTAPSSNGSGAGGNAGAAGNVTQAGAGSGTGGVSVGGVAGSAALAGMGGAMGGGQAGTSGAAAGGGAGGVGAGGEGPDTSVKPSMGCMNPTMQALDEWVHYKLTIQNAERDYAVRLPKTFDPTKPHRLLFTFPWGNGDSETTSPYYNQPNADGIFVGVTSLDGFFEYTANSYDVEYFDKLLEVVKANFCVDENRIFASGMSSGSWFTNVLGCQRSNVLRAQGNISGCWPDDGRLDPAVEAGMPSTVCEKRNIAGIFIHDASDGTNTLECGIMARNRLLLHNGCTMETRPVEPDPCVEYQGCKSGYPVIWCQTDGTGHSQQDGLTIPAIYNFFAQF